MSEYAVMPLSDYAKICDAIREKTGCADGIKSTEMADEISKVHNAGQISALDTSGRLKNTVSGNVIAVNDISPIEHNLSVKLSSDTVEDFSGVSVRVCGKNLFPYPYAVTTNTTNGITFTDNGDGSITVNGTATDTTYFRIGNLFNMPATQYYLSGCDDGTVDMHIEAYSEDNKWVAGTANTRPFDLTDKTFYRLYTILRVNSGVTVENVTVKPQLEFGTAPTEFECGKEPQTVTANADGAVEGLISLYPNITVFTDNPDVNIELGYYKDIEVLCEETYEYGMQTEYDRFWDALQNYGNRTSYELTFALHWNDEIFKPKYNVAPTGTMSRTFAYSSITDLAKRFEETGTVLDTSQVTAFSDPFSYGSITHVPVVSTISADTFTNIFYNNQSLKKVDKLILREDGSQTFGKDSFKGIYVLVDIEIEGCIGSTVNFKSGSKLSAESIKSIINVLSTTVSGQTATFSLTAVNNAFETSKGLADGSTSEEWLALINTKSNWTIVL